MIKQKELVPKRRFDEFEEEWKVYKFKNLAEIVRGASPRPIQDPKWFDKSSDIGWLRISDVTQQNGQIEYLEQRLSKLGEEKTRVLHEPHLLLSIAATVGKPVINHVKTGVHDGFLIFKKQQFNICFMYQWLEFFRSSWSKYGQPGSQVNLNSEIVKEQTIDLPIMKEQQKIGKFFKHLDEMIALEQRKIDKTKALKSAYLAEMFSAEGESLPKRRFEGFTDEWEAKILGNIGQTFTGLSGKTKEDFGRGNAEFVTYLNVFNNPISNTNITENVEIDTKQDEVKYGDVLFTTSSETPHEVGMSSVWLFNRPNVYLNSFCFGYRISINIDYLFIAYLFRSNMIRKQMKVLAQGISRYNISKNKVMEIMVLLPSKREQKKIGEFFKNLDDIIETHEQKLEKLKATKQAYLHEMFV